MSEIISLLKEKNEHLERFLHLNTNELEFIDEGNFENLEDFYYSRDCLLTMINKVDERINDINRGLLTQSELSLNEKKSVISELDRKNDYVQRILSQDLQILSAIEKEKSCIIKELKKTNVVKKVFSSYKSGENFGSSKIDEEV